MFCADICFNLSKNPRNRPFAQVAIGTLLYPSASSMRDLDDLFAQLTTSSFRQRFHLHPKERQYLEQKGMEVIKQHAADFVEKRLAPALPANDGKQTPYRNHPVFVAQHATATCCRGCLEKWHGIAKGKPLDLQEQQYIVAVLEHWLVQEIGNDRTSI